MTRFKIVLAVAMLGVALAGCGDPKPTEPDDRFPPLISWNAPAADTSFTTDTVTVQFTAADDGGVVSEVKVYRDGALAATLVAEPYRVTLDMSALGNHRATFVYATASDPTGKVGATADTLRFLKAFPPDTAVWTQLTGFGSQPLARYGHSMSVDVPGKRAVVFGGYNVLNVFGPVNDTWAFNFDTDTWDSLATAGTVPAKRYAHAGGVAGHLLVVFGGRSQTDTLMEDYAILDLTTLVWSISFVGSRPQPSHGIATAVFGNELFLYGGSYDTGPGNPDENSGNLWRFSATDSLFSLVAASNLAGRRFRSAMATDLEGDRLFLYGGRSGVPSSETPSDASNYRWTISTQTWRSSAAPGPPPLESAVVIYDSLHNRMLVWGGKDASGTPSTKLWQFSLGGLFWEEVPTKDAPPTGRTDFGMVKDPDSSRVILFGGLVSGNSNGETWELAW